MSPGHACSAQVGCDYCGLPVRRRRRTESSIEAAIGEKSASHGRHPAKDEPVFCCLGCRIAQGIAEGDSDSGLGKTAFQLALAVFFSMNVMVFTMVLWSWDTYAIATSENAAAFKELLRFACLLFATPVVLILGRPLVEAVFSQFRNRNLSADGLLLMGVLAAFGYSVMSLFSGGEHIYFEVACMILLAVTIGRWIEAEGKQRATRSLATLQHLLPDSAVVIDGSDTKEVALSDVAVGSHIRIRPGERVPLDGIVVAGKSFVDKQLITGESEFSSVSIDDQVFGGFANVDGTLEVEVTATVDMGVVQRLVSAVNSAVGSKSRPERLADRLAATLAILIVAVSTWVFALHYRDSGLQSAFMASMAVVLIACPCALGVATPLAIWSSLSAAAARGIVFKTSDDLLQLGRVDHICFDKTGTITTGEAWLAHGWIDADTEKERLRTSEIVRAICVHSIHPLAKAAVNHFASVLPPSDVHVLDGIQCVPGQGLVGMLALKRTTDCISRTNCAEEMKVVLGNVKHCCSQGLMISSQAEKAIADASDNGHSLLLAGWQGEVRAVLAFDETIRERARVSLQQLQSLGISASVLTGDHSARANRLAVELGIPVASELLPEEKLDHVEQLKKRPAEAATSKTERTYRKEGLQPGRNIVAMIGDGLNDAPALAAADVGIAMGCGTEITRDAADVCLLSSDLALIPWSIELSRRTRRIISRNLFWAVAYNCIGVVLAATGRLNPIFAAAAMVLSSIFVISNSLRLLRDKESNQSNHVDIPHPSGAMVPTSRDVSGGSREQDRQPWTDICPTSDAKVASHE